MSFIKLNNFKPKIGEYVNFIFTEHKDNYLCCKLTDYNLDCIMTFQCLTNKKKIKSLKSLAPINKENIGIIENIDNENIELNLTNVNKNSDDYYNFLKLNQSNHVLKKKINQYIHKYDKNLYYVLENYIYTLDNSSNYLEQILDSSLDNDFYNFIKSENKNEKKINEYTFKMHTSGDINNIIKLLDETIEESKISDINIVQSKVSEYRTTSNFSLDDFTILLKNNISKYNDIYLE